MSLWESAPLEEELRRCRNSLNDELHNLNSLPAGWAGSLGKLDNSPNPRNFDLVGAVCSIDERRVGLN